MEWQEYAITSTSGSPVFQIIENCIEEYRKQFWKCSYCRTMNFEIKKSNRISCGASKENNNDKTVG